MSKLTKFHSKTMSRWWCRTLNTCPQRAPNHIRSCIWKVFMMLFLFLHWRKQQFYITTLLSVFSKLTSIINITVHRFGGFSLIRLQLVAPLHLHGAVNDPVWSQRLQSLNLHDHHLTHTTQTWTFFNMSKDNGSPLWTSREQIPKYLITIFIWGDF